MSNNSGDADGTIGSRVTLDEVEVDHLPRSRDADVGREAVFDLSDHRDSHGLGIVLLPPSAQRRAGDRRVQRVHAAGRTWALAFGRGRREKASSDLGCWGPLS